MVLKTRAVDPDSFNPDPDPTFQGNPDCLIFFDQNCNLLMSKLQKKPSAFKREHPELQKMNFINFFLCLWVIFALLDPDPDCESRDPSELGSSPDSEQQNCKKLLHIT
jgi:hypothetical protein